MCRGFCSPTGRSEGNFQQKISDPDTHSDGVRVKSCMRAALLGGPHLLSAYRILLSGFPILSFYHERNPRLVAPQFDFNRIRPECLDRLR